MPEQWNDLCIALKSGRREEVPFLLVWWEWFYPCMRSLCLALWMGITRHPNSGPPDGSSRKARDFFSMHLPSFPGSQIGKEGKEAKWFGDYFLFCGIFMKSLKGYGFITETLLSFQMWSSCSDWHVPSGEMNIPRDQSTCPGFLNVHEYFYLLETFLGKGSFIWALA